MKSRRRHRSLSSTFCRCIKHVQKTVIPRNDRTKEGAAIGICVRSVLYPRGKTLKRFTCKKKKQLITQSK